MIFAQESELPALPLGDLVVLGRPPAKLIKALAVIAEGLHGIYDALPWIKPGHSQTACILSSLTVRDYLFRIGFHDAEIRPCMLAIRARRDIEELHSLGIGEPDLREVAREAARGRKATGWSGHMVVVLPKAEWVIDTTLYQARRKQWPDLPGMLALPLAESRDVKAFGLHPMTGLYADPGDGSTVDMLWLDQPKNRYWRLAPDGRDRKRRELVIRALVERFGEWKD